MAVISIDRLNFKLSIRKHNVESIISFEKLTKELLANALHNATSMLEEVTIFDGNKTIHLPKSLDGLNYPIIKNDSVIRTVPHLRGESYGAVEYKKAEKILALL